MLGRSGAFWAREYHDRYVRDADHFGNAKAYIEGNPVKARLCAKVATTTLAGLTRLAVRSGLVDA